MFATAMIIIAAVDLLWFILTPSEASEERPVDRARLKAWLCDRAWQNVDWYEECRFVRRDLAQGREPV